MGLLEEVVYIMGSLFAGAICLVLGYYMVTQIGALPQFASLPTTTAAVGAIAGLDMALITGVIFLSIGSVILAYFIPSHPAFFFTYILTLALVILLAPQLSNVYATLAGVGPVSAAFQAFPLTAAFIGNLPIFALALSTLLAVVSYGKGFRQTVQGL